MAEGLARPAGAKGHAVSSNSAGAPSLVFRLAVTISALLALLASLAAFAAHRYGWQAANEAYDKLLTGALLQISERISAVDEELVVDLPVSAFELLALARDDRVFYRIIDPAGQTVSGYDDLPLPERILPGEPMVYEADFSGERIRLALRERRLAERQLSGVVKVVVAHTMEERSRLALDITSKALALIAAASLATLVVALFALRYALRPLERIEQALLKRDPNDLSPFEVSTPRELGTMMEAINRFMARLDRRVSAMQGFVADAAHQMRTPITALRAQAELAIKEKDPERLRQLNGRILKRAIGVSRLTDQLLSKALITHRSETAQLVPVDLRRVAIDAEREVRASSTHGNAHVTLDLPEEPVMAHGDAFSLREALKNLVGNAMRYGKPPLELKISIIGSEIALSVIDCGPGIAATRRAEIGKRFAMAEDTPESAGLGLAIVSDVASYHSGRVVAEDLPDGRFAMILFLPLERT